MAAISATDLSALLQTCFALTVPETHSRIAPLGTRNDIDDSVKAPLEVAPAIIRAWVTATHSNDQTKAALFNPYLTACLAALKLVSKYRAQGVATVAKAGAFVISYMGMNFTKLELELNDRPLKLPMLAAIMDAAQALPLPQQDPLRRWAKGINASNNVLAVDKTKKVIEALATPDTTMTKKMAKILAVMDTAVIDAKTMLLPGNCFEGCTPGLTPLHGIMDDTNRDAVIDLWALAKPGKTFSGFTRWGKANYASLAECELGHFRKHVLRAPLHGAPDPDDGEHAKWWSLLKIELKRDVVEQALLAGGTGRVLSTAELGWFDVSQNLKSAHVTDFVTSDILAKAPNAITHLKDRYMAAFTAAGLQASATAPLVFAFASREFAMVACFNGTMFIVGRIDNGVIAMSSAYIPSDLADKKKSAAMNLLWLMKS